MKIFLFLLSFLAVSCPDIATADVTVPSASKDIYTHYNFNRLSLYLLDDTYYADSSGNTMRVAAPDLAADTTVFLFPATNGTANYGLLTDGSGATSWAEVLLPSATQTVTNKTIDADANTITNIEDADIKAGAAIQRSKVANGTADHVVVNDGSGTLSSEAQLSKTRGGTGVSSTATFPTSGVVVTEDGTHTLTNKTIDADGTGNSITNIENADIKVGAAVDRSKLASGTSDHVVINDGSGVLSSEAQLASTRGGTGISSTATFPSSGVIVTEGATQTLTDKTLTSPVLDTGVSGTAIKDEDDMVSDSATHLATQQSIKAYVDTEIAGVSATGSDYLAAVADYTVTDGDQVRTVGMTTGATDRTVTLPTAADNTNRIITAKKVDSGAGTLTIDGEGAETIDGSTTRIIASQYAAVTVQSDGTSWHTISQEIVNQSHVYTFNSWNPSGTGSTSTNPSGGSESLASGMVSSSFSSGVLTLTFDEPGIYTVTVNAAHNHANTYTQGRTTVMYGGTATRYGVMATTAFVAPNIDSDNSSVDGSATIVVDADEGETLTVAPTYDSNGISSTSQHVAYCNVITRKSF